MMLIDERARVEKHPLLKKIQLFLLTKLTFYTGKVNFNCTNLIILFSSGKLVIEAEKLPWQIQQPS
jgi:hypothetical protein